MEKETMIIGILAIMVLVTGMQTLQLQNMQSAVQSGTLSLTTQTTGAATAGAAITPQAAQGNAQAVPSGLQNMPDMVGGC
ncbi:MAG: hypothetical protein J4432_03115 [DPANN group archaeon]|nr:hypothetical protein [DPANN group archaeon]